MKAVRVNGFGGAEQLQVVEIADPVAAPGQVLVRAGACALNYSDLLQRAGLYLGGPKPPFIAGTEAAGTVLDAPPGSGIEAGQRVMLLTPGGAHAELVAVAPERCVPVPADLSFPAAASLLVPFLTAYHCLVTVGRCQPGELVVVHAAAGGLGAALVQVAVALDLRVLATASTAEKRAHALALGAEAVSDYDGFAATASRMTARRGVDLVIDGVGGDVFRDSMRVLSPFGRLVIVGCTSGDVQRVDTTRLLFRSQTVSGFHLTDLLPRTDVLHRSLEQLWAWLGSGTIVARAHHVLPLEEVADAHRLLESRDRIGRVVLTP